MTTTQSGLGISPVLLQAIAQTLTASNASSSKDSSMAIQPSSSSNEFTPESIPLPVNVRKLCNESNSEMESSSEFKDSSRVVSQLLQKLNEPVASLLAQTSNISQHPQSVISGISGQSAPDSNQSSITQAGLSMLGIDQSQISGSQQPNSVLYAPESQAQVQTAMAISGEELSNFLMKEEPVDEEVASPILPASHVLKSQTVNTNVSSVLSALASQHVRQRGLAREGEQQYQNHRLKETSTVISNTNTSPTSADTSESLSQSSRTQPQIIIYGLQYNNNNNNDGLEVPMSSEGGNIVVTERGENGGVSTAYLLQPSKSGTGSTVQNKSLSSEVNPAYGLSFSDNPMPVSNIQNPLEGLPQPCPICADKISGKKPFNYIIFCIYVLVFNSNSTLYVLIIFPNMIYMIIH